MSLPACPTYPMKKTCKKHGTKRFWKRSKNNDVMKKMPIFPSFALCLAALLVSPFAQALPRDQVQTARFKRANPCPATNRIKGPCKGYNVDHKQSLMTGGVDRPENMQWVKREDHKKKTKQDFADCKAGPVCLHRGLRK